MNENSSRGMTRASLPASDGRPSVATESERPVSDLDLFSILRMEDRTHSMESTLIRVGLLRSLVRELQARRLTASAGSAGWHPIETAPKDGTVVVFGWHGDKHIETGLWRKDADTWMGEVSGFWKPKDYPTDWQPLPSAPVGSRRPPMKAGV